MQAAINSLPNLTEEQQLLQCLAQGEINAFWQLFEQYRDYLFRCCVKWTNGNLTEAEDLLSQAMLKALEKAQKYAGKIENFKSWLTTLTRNFWIDLKRRPCVKQVENIEVYGEREDLGWVAVDDTPGSALERDDKNRVIRAAIDELPTQMRETFILHFYEELSYQEIVERQGISYPNVCKRISQARGILAKELRGYFIEEKTSTEVSIAPVAIEPVVEVTPLENAGIEPILDDPILSVAVAEVESVVVEKSAEVVVSEQQSESDFVAVTSEGRLEEFKAIRKQIVGVVSSWLYVSEVHCCFIADGVTTPLKG
jgi:RNA polymerase sigma factor (sigma-70 family)